MAFNQSLCPCLSGFGGRGRECSVEHRGQRCRGSPSPASSATTHTFGWCHPTRLHARATPRTCCPVPTPSFLHSTSAPGESPTQAGPEQQSHRALISLSHMRKILSFKKLILSHLAKEMDFLRFPKFPQKAEQFTDT